MVNIVNFTLAVTQLYHSFNNAQNIVFTQRTVGIRCLFKRNVERNVHFNTTDRRQIITVFVKEQSLEQSIGRFIRRRITRTHNAVNIQKRLLTAGILINCQRVADIRTDIDAVDKQDLNRIDFIGRKFFQHFLGDFITGLGQNFTGFGNDNIIGQKLADNFVAGYFEISQSFIGQFLRRTGCQFLAGFPNRFTGFGINQIKVKFDPFHAGRFKLDFPIFFNGLKSIGIIEVIKNFFFIHTFNFAAVDMLAFFGQLGNFFFGFFGIQRIQN